MSLRTKWLRILVHSIEFMTYQAVFTGWDKLTVEDLLIAYRKAKADCFFEDTFPTAIKFTEYEQNLLKNITTLLKKLQDNNGFETDQNLIGDFRLLPKKLSVENKSGEPVNGHDRQRKLARDSHSYF